MSKTTCMPIGYTCPLPSDVRALLKKGKRWSAGMVLSELTSYSALENQHSKSPYKMVWPSQQSIAECIGASLATVQRAIRFLIDQGIIYTEATYCAAKHWRLANRTYFLFNQHGLIANLKPGKAATKGAVSQPVPQPDAELPTQPSEPAAPLPPVTVEQMQQWVAARNILQRATEPSIFESWHTQTRLHGVDGRTWLFEVSDLDFARFYAMNGLQEDLRDALQQAGAAMNELHLVVAVETNPVLPEPSAPDPPADRRRSGKRR